MKYSSVILGLMFMIGVAFESTAQNTITTVAGDGAIGYWGDGGPATDAQLNMPGKVFADAVGNFYITDMLNNHVVRKVSAAGEITTVAGNGVSGSSGDGGPAIVASIYWPAGVCADLSGNIYITDAFSNVIRKVDAATGNISTIAGTGTAGYTGDGGPATNAALSGPQGICINATGDIFFTEYGNGTIRKIHASTGIITTIAGTGTSGFAGDGGQATNAQLNRPDGIAISASGDIYVADVNAARVRKINAGSGVIMTVAGNGMADYTGDEGAATNASLFNPTDISLDNVGNLYIADLSNNVIRRVDALGIISTYAGNGSNGYTGDGGLAADAELSAPSGVSYANGGLYKADGGNNVIRKVVSGSMGVGDGVSSISAGIFPNPASGTFQIEWNNLQEAGNATVVLTDVTARQVMTTTVDMSSAAGQAPVNVSGLSSGLYMLHIRANGMNVNTKIELQ